MRHFRYTLTRFYMRRVITIRKFIIGFLIGSLIFGGFAYALRTPRPTQLTIPFDDNKITELNNILENLWNITNGKYNFDVKDSVESLEGIL